MFNLFILNETFTNGFTHILLNFISVLSILCGIFVIVSKNPIVSVLFLIGLFLTIAGYLMMLGINFIGLSYLLVYVGAVSILFLFILMLINIRVSELITNSNNGIPLAIFIGVFFNITLYNIFPSNKIVSKKNYSDIILDRIDYNLDYSFANNIFNLDKTNDISLVTSQIWDGALSDSSHITTIGNILYTVYPLWLIVTSIILLLAMVGAIIITIKQ